MQKRPYTNDSIDKLEEIFEAASAANNVQGLLILFHELQFRRTSRGKELRGIVQSQLVALGVDPASQEPPSTAARAQRQPGKGVETAGAAPARRHGPKSPPRRPTDEQEQAIRLFSTGGSLKINAYAGSGKTSTLEFLAASTRRRGLYLAFNRSIVAEAKRRFPSSVTCTTTHGLAFSAVSACYNGNIGKLTQSLTPNHLVEILKLKSWSVTPTVTLGARSLGYLIRETINKFTISAAPEIEPRHVPVYGAMNMLPDASLLDVQQFCVQRARCLWSRMIDPADPLTLGHDGYLKVWALGAPSINADYILLDEAQDTNAVLLGVLKHQSAQIVFVGDRYQQIYEWRGAENAMQQFDTEHASSLTTSFRFGRGIAGGANKVLGLLGAPDTLHGNPAKTSRIMPVERPRAILARTNANVIAATIEALDENQRPHLVGGAEDLKRMLRGVILLKENKPTDVPEFFGFTSWNDVLDFARSQEGEHLITFVNLVEERGEQHLLWLLSQVVEEADADVVISTAHKAKGREWSTVRLVGEFLQTKSELCPTTGRRIFLNAFEPASLRLLYVAMTRAQDAVEFPQALIDLLRHGPNPGPATGDKQPNPSTLPAVPSIADRQKAAIFGQPEHLRPESKGKATALEPQPAPAGTNRFLKWFTG